MALGAARDIQASCSLWVRSWLAQSQLMFCSWSRKIFLACI